MQLADILRSVHIKSVSGSLETEIDSLCHDSRRAGEGALFFALPGVKTDGSGFIGQAVEAGAAAVVSEKPYPAESSVPWIQVTDARRAMARAAAEFYGHPSRDFPVIGITGTNGKTTTAFLTHHLIASSRGRCGLIGTVRYQIGDRTVAAPHTTPESVDLQALLAAMRDEDCRAAVMEVSSHALAQQRTGEVRFAVGVFTNLSQDHLDYHQSMPAYFAAKRKLFEQMESQGADTGEPPAVVVNRDDKYGERLAKANLPHTRLITYGQGVLCDFRAGNIRSDFNGTQFQLSIRGRRMLVRIPLIGRFNVYNAVAALAAGQAIDLNLREAVRAIADAPQVPGRLESVGDRKIAFRVYVDYAHTPDALENALKTVRDLEPRRVITVFGCGGDRDRGKRPKMGRVADELSDFAILTSDNPRTESPAAIIKDTLEGVSSQRVKAIEDRREAIAEAIRMAGDRDIVLIAGKGHETYQEIDGVRHPFDDREVAKRFIVDRVEGNL
ncbi:MAG: UDP-N-acetylmuramoyl-L-alanyl-D-glutamate--2,6-diaminopimelate ligase [Verrucomicrobiae bacterium]|nr:UDP-N-acetylmuramoyl-L-alanyl-D-glutamate--2,6-diaminopimelate ligase [Verrucomicrobiae bacterium]